MICTQTALVRLLTLTMLLLTSQGSVCAAITDEAGSTVRYENVRNILRKRCVTCHNLDEMRGDLNLADLPAIMAGSASGPVVVPGKPNQSLLYKTAAHLEDPVMSPNSPRIPASELELLRRWIESGIENSSAAKQEVANPGMEQANNQAVPSLDDAESANLNSNAGATQSGFVQVAALARPTAITALDTHPSREVAAVAGDRQVVLFDTSTGALIGGLAFPEGDVTAIRFSRDGNQLVAGGGVAGLSGTVVGFDVASGKRVFEVADENDTILALDISPDGEFVAVGGQAKVVRVYNVKSRKAVLTFRKHTDWVLSLQYSPDGLLLGSGDRFGGLFVWNAKTGEEFAALRGHSGAVNSICWRSDGGSVISAGEDGILRRWNMHRGELDAQWDGRGGALLSMSCKTNLVVCGGRTNTVVAWQIADFPEGEGRGKEGISIDRIASSEKQLASVRGDNQIERLAVTVSGAIVSTDAAGKIHVLAPTSMESQVAFHLPVDISQREKLKLKLDSAAQQYALRMKAEKNQSLQSVQVENAGSANAALDAEISLVEKQATLLREELTAVEKSTKEMGATIESLTSTIDRLRQTQVELQSQLKQKSRMFELNEQLHSALVTLQEKMVSTAATGQLPNDADVLSKRTAEVRQKLLQSAMSLRTQLNETRDQDQSGDLETVRALVEILTKELKGK